MHRGPGRNGLSPLRQCLSPCQSPFRARRGPRLSSESPLKERHCKHGVAVGSSCSIKMAFQCLKQKQKHGLNRKKDQKDFCPLLFFSVFALSIQSDASTEWEDFPNGFVTTLSLVTYPGSLPSRK